MYKIEQNEINLEKQSLSINQLKVKEYIESSELPSKAKNDVDVERLVSLAKIRNSSNSILNNETKLNQNNTSSYLEQINNELSNSSSNSYLASASYLVSTNSVSNLITHDCDIDDDEIQNDE